jgi:hypothetical protein
MLHEDYVHFLFGAKIYALHRLTGQPHLAHLEAATGVQSASYIPIEYQQLPDQVKRWWTEYKEQTSFEGQAAGGQLGRVGHRPSEVEP